MQLPFTTDQFIAVFSAYNKAIGPLPLVAYALGATAAYAAIKGLRQSGRIVGLVLAGLWAWTGIAYHLMSFSAINPAARAFGIAFIVQAVAFASVALRGKLEFDFSLRRARSRMGLVMITFSMVVYPLIGMLSGHGYPNGPVFGLTPCPLTIFTFGILLLSSRSLPKHLLVIPFAWALIGAMAAVSLGIREDVGLLVTGTLATIMLLTRRANPTPGLAETRRRGRRTTTPDVADAGATAARVR